MPRLAAVLGLVCTLFAIPVVAAAQSPPLTTLVWGTEISWDDCKSRVSAAFAAHGYTGLRDFGNGWFASARGQSASMACIPTARQTVVVITTAGNDANNERDRLFASYQNPGTVGPAGPWISRGTGDCTGRDWASSSGLDNSKCTAETAGRTAVCWDGITLKHPGRAGAWCTYKTVAPQNCTDGANKGYLYLCAPTAAAPQPPPTSSQPPPQPQPNSMSFPNPTYQGHPVSNCLNFGVGCGQPAADRFCVSAGYARSTEYKIAYGGWPWLWDANKVCDDPGCAKLVNVVCTRP